MRLVDLALQVLICFLISTLFWFIVEFRRRNDRKRGPGPTLLPGLGRVHDLPLQHTWFKLKEWGDRYAARGYYRVDLLDTRFFVITDEKIAYELLVKRAKTNSDRPAVPSIVDSKSANGSMEYLPLMGHNDFWSRQRKLTHFFLSDGNSTHYRGILYHESKRWIARLMRNPDAFQWSLEDMASKVMCALTWDDPNQSETLIRSAWALLRQMSPAGPITNVIPQLWKLPYIINPWKQAERKRHDEQIAWWLERLKDSKEKWKKGELRQCWTCDYFEMTAAAKLDRKMTLSCDYEAACVLGMLALVGIFTVAGPLNYWLVAMVNFPEWQRAVQREVDTVCQGSLPTLEDIPRLPILRACIKETMRWRPNVPTGVAHEAEVDQEWDGCVITKGTRILPLDYAFLRNPIKFPDPESFRPERWLEPGWPTYREPLTQFPTIRGMTTFGWGQRQCLGMSLTQDEMVVACGALAWAFHLECKAHPLTGEVFPVPDNKCNSLLIVKPDPFQMAFTPRSQARRLEALRIWESANRRDLKERKVRLEDT